MVLSRVPGCLPTMTQGLWGRRAIPASTVSAAGVSGTMRAPVLPSRSRNSPAVRSTSSQRSVRISLKPAAGEHEQPQRRDGVGGDGTVHTRRRVRLGLRQRPTQAPVLLAGEEPLALLLPDTCARRGRGWCRRPPSPRRRRGRTSSTARRGRGWRLWVSRGAGSGAPARGSARPWRAASCRGRGECGYRASHDRCRRYGRCSSARRGRTCSARRGRRR